LRNNIEDSLSQLPRKTHDAIQIGYHVVTGPDPCLLNFRVETYRNVEFRGSTDLTPGRGASTFGKDLVNIKYRLSLADGIISYDGCKIEESRITNRKPEIAMFLQVPQPSIDHNAGNTKFMCSQGHETAKDGVDMGKWLRDEKDGIFRDLVNL
jgi:hypothetical protein